MTRIDYESSKSIVLSFAFFFFYIMKLYFTIIKTIFIILVQMGVHLIEIVENKNK